MNDPRFHVRMLTNQGPRWERPVVCAEESVIDAPKDQIAHAFGTRWRWSMIQKCWTEVEGIHR